MRFPGLIHISSAQKLFQCVRRTIMEHFRMEGASGNVSGKALLKAGLSEQIRAVSSQISRTTKAGDPQTLQEACCQLLFYEQEVFSLLPFQSSSWLLTCCYLHSPQRNVCFCHFCSSHSRYFCNSRAEKAEIRAAFPSSALQAEHRQLFPPLLTPHALLSPHVFCGLLLNLLSLLMKGSKSGLATQNDVLKVLKEE